MCIHVTLLYDFPMVTHLASSQTKPYTFCLVSLDVIALATDNTQNQVCHGNMTPVRKVHVYNNHWARQLVVIPVLKHGQAK